MTPDDDEETRDALIVFGAAIVLVLVLSLCGYALLAHEEPWHVLASLMGWW